MKLCAKVFGNRYALGLTACILTIVGPVIFGLMLSIPIAVYPDDCDIRGRCEHSVVEIARSLSFDLIFWAPVLMLLGVFGVIALGAVWGISAFKSKYTGGLLSKNVRQSIGIVCGGIVAYLIYIPSGPDPCSRAITDTRYEKCLESVFQGRSFAETREWLERYGYTSFPDSRGGDADRSAFLVEDGKATIRYDKWFLSFREHGPIKSVPYGTNFNRIFVRTPPAPDRFRINVFGWEEEDRIVRVQVWWAFSFL